MFAAAYFVSLDWKPDGGIAYRLDLMRHLGFPLGLGVLAYVWRDRLPIDGRIAVALWVVTVLAAGLGLMIPAITVAVAYSTIWFGFAIKSPLLAFNRIGDYSYGVYIYAFPVQQALVHFVPGMTPLDNMLFALPLTLVLAALSWFVIKKRSLALIDPVASRLERAVVRRGQFRQLEAHRQIMGAERWRGDTADAPAKHRSTDGLRG